MPTKHFSTTSQIPAVLAVLLLSGSAFAQDAGARVGQTEDQLILEAEGHRLSTDLPAWFAQAGVSNLSETEVIITGDDNSTRFEIVPGGQNAQRWTHMYGVRIVLEPERNLSEYRQAAAYGYALSCDGTTGEMLLADADTEDRIAPLIFVCGQFIPSANRDGEGEMMAMAFRRSDAGIAVVYEEYRTPSFDGKDRASWPISGESIVARARALQAAANLVELDELSQ